MDQQIAVRAGPSFADFAWKPYDFWSILTSLCRPICHFDRPKLG